MTITRIVVPTDFSVDAETATRYAIELAQRFDASVHLLHVVESPIMAGAWSSELYTTEIAGLQVNLVRDAEEHLRRYVATASSSVPLSSEVRTGPAATTISDAARDLSADLIVMGTSGRTGLAHMLMGSVAERVVRTAPCPVLTMRGAAAGGSARKTTAA
jgi:universal stress protein A